MLKFKFLFRVPRNGRSDPLMSRNRAEVSNMVAKKGAEGSYMAEDLRRERRRDTLEEAYCVTTNNTPFLLCTLVSQQWQ